MKAMSKSELADAAGVSVKVLMNWCKPYRKEFEVMGLKPKDRVLPPKIVKFIAEKFCIGQALLCLVRFIVPCLPSCENASSGCRTFALSEGAFTGFNSRTFSY